MAWRMGSLTRRMEGLTRRMWTMPAKSSACCESCTWRKDGLYAQRARRLAREHTRRTGHVTRAAEVKVTEYRRTA